jgi:hypothetical protein
MKKRYDFGLLAGLLLYAQLVYAQLPTENDTTKCLKSFLKLTVSDVSGLEWEQKIGKKATINLVGGIAVGTTADGFSFSNFTAHLTTVFSTYAEYRNYYNLIERIIKKKK